LTNTRKFAIIAIVESKQKMPNTETLTFTPPTTEEHEVARKVASFETAKGSIYTYDEDGKTTRFKPAAIARGETPDQNRQDVTVFVHLSPDAQQKYLDAIHAHTDDPTRKRKVYVVERQTDGTPRIIRDIAQITDPENVYLAALRNGLVIGSTKASIQPELGANVFDTRHYLEQDKWLTERHLGNKVVKRNYE
jgi:hypothetical protein